VKIPPQYDSSYLRGRRDKSSIDLCYLIRRLNNLLDVVDTCYIQSITIQLGADRGFDDSKRKKIKKEESVRFAIVNVLAM